MFTYRAFNLNLISSLSFPELIPSDHLSQEAVRIQEGEVLFDADKTWFYQEKKAFFLKINHVAIFKIAEGNCITYAPFPEAEEEMIRLFILGSCMGVLLQQRGLVVLHGNAVSFDGKSASLFVGESGAGKSTTAAWYLRQGAKVLADDVCAVQLRKNQAPLVLPSFPQIKLWKESAELLSIDTTRLNKVRQTQEKYALPLQTAFHDASLPIHQIMEINQEKIDPHPLSVVDKIHLLFRHSYRAEFLLEKWLRVNYIQQLVQLIACVKIEKTPRVLLSV